MLHLFKVAIILYISNCAFSYSIDEVNAAKRKIISLDRLFIKHDEEYGCWPHHTVPYNIKDGFSDSQIQQIFSNIYQIQNKTCVRFVEKRLVQNESKWVEFKYEKGDICQMIDEIGENNTLVSRITLGDICFNPKVDVPKQVLHEMMHALGFTHEHQRVDRDCYIDVDEHNAENDNQFKIIYNSLFEKWPYDKKSVVHYPRRDFIKDKDEGLFEYKPLGTNEEILSCLDIEKINFRYCNAPDYCEINPKKCQKIEEEEAEKGCKQIYLDVAAREHP